VELLFEIIFRGLIVNVIGLYTRYFFFKIIGIEKSIEYLSGEKKNNDHQNFSQNVLNGIVGLIVFCSLSVFMAWLVYS
jgi:hypothetical protein